MIKTYKILFVFILLFVFSTFIISIQGQNKAKVPDQLMGNRFLTFNTIIRVNQIEVSRDRNEGMDERGAHTPERVIAFREAISSEYPEARITWAFSWLALHDQTDNYKKIRELVVGYHHKYGDDITFIPGAYFANAYNSREQVNKDLHDGLAKVSEIVGNGFRPKSVLAGFLAAENQQYLAEKEGIHVCQGNIWSQFSIDNQDGDGAVSYPFYPSKEHFCKPAQGKDDFIDCVNLDGWSMDFLAARRDGFAGGFNSRMGVGPIETIYAYGKLIGLTEMLHTTALHYDRGFELNGFAWVTNCWELSLPIDVSGLKDWLNEIKRNWSDVKFITQGEFGLLWREHYKDNSFNYRFEQKGSGIGGSDINLQIRWFMNKDFRLALVKDWQKNRRNAEYVIDFTNYNLKAEEPKDMTRKWSLLGEINQKQSRPQDRPKPISQISTEGISLIKKHYPYLYSD
ncbi:DUF3863 domain-containing protein [Prevotella sp. 10(H)]|uniref:DUF3863 domain-containing protein n=1 Tax=Prevotella sp. 10(H) TaxID=1158294 RepID=UPI000689A755|nr:DUF3863 domain-containing protein [Prevotella sp. 10(H)]